MYNKRLFGAKVSETGGLYMLRLFMSTEEIKTCGLDLSSESRHPEM